MTSVLVGFTTIWVVIGLGWLLARLRILKAESQQTLGDLAFYLGIPAMLFLLMARADLAQAFAPHLAASCAAMGVAALLYIASEVLVWRRGVGDAVVGTFGSYYVNAANIGIPIATYVLGDATWAVPVLLVQVAVLQPIGLTILDVREAKAAGRSPSLARIGTMPFRNPITIASLLGIGVNLLHLELPEIVVAPATLVAQLGVPTMLMAFGVSLFVGGIPGTSPHTPQVAWIASIKLLWMPLAAWLLARYAFHLDAHATFAVTVTAGLPTAQNVFVNALRYRNSVGLARDVVFFTTILSIPTMLVIALLARA